MKRKAIAFSALFLFVGSAAYAQLAWEKTQLDLRPAVGDAEAVGVFKYENKGDKPIHFTSVKTSCGCTAAAPAKNDVAPGEKGEIKATFKIGDRQGTQVKTVTVMTDDPSQPTSVLTLKAVIPQFLELQPAFVFWETGEASKPKTILAKAGKDVVIKNIDVLSSSPDFTTKVERGSAAGEFKINVEPRDTTKQLSATLTIKPDAAPMAAKVYYASARVTPKATTARATPPAAATN